MTENITTPHTEVIDFDPFAGPEIVHLAPSTEPQQEVWTACLLGGDNATRAYNISISLRLIGPLNRPAMEQAIQALVRRHDALRSVFSADGEHLCIYKEVAIDSAYEDISEKAVEEKNRIIADYIKQDACYVFNLLHGPLFRTGLFKLSDQEHRLVLTAHHSISDGWSMGVILQDLSAFYSAYTQGITPHLSEAPSFAQYAIEQHQFSVSDAYSQVEEFWVNKYKESVPAFDLPTDFPRPAFRTFKSNRLDYPLDNDLVAAVRKMGIKAGCSFVTTLLAAFDVLLHRLSGQEDIVVGLPTAGQSITDNKQLVGHCVNLLPLRSHLDAGLRFSDFLKVSKQSVFEAYEHQRLTFSSLLKKINIPRDTSRVPLVPVIFNVDMGMDDGVDFYNLTHQLISHPKEYENFEWFFNVNEFEKNLTVEWTYNTQLFKAETIDRTMAEFENLLKTVVADPAILIGDIKFKSEHRLNEKLTQWNNTDAEYPRHTSLHKLIAQTALNYPNKVALVFNKQQISYQALNETANQLAHFLIQKEIKVGDIVGIALDRSPEMLITLLAVLKTGAAYLPLDPEYPNDRLTFMLADSSAKLLITSEKYKQNLNSQTPEILIEDAINESKICVKEEPERFVAGNDLAYVLYTSGSTGKPKGVLIEHHNLVNFLWSMKEVPGISQNDVLLAVTTISFDIAGLELYLPLLVGATVLIADTVTARDGRALLDLVESGNVSIMQATPSTWRMMLDSGWNKYLPLKVLCGGEALPKDLAEKLIPNCNELWNVYGPTETTIWSTIKKINGGEIITIGRPINNTQVYILDEFLKPVAEETVGELYIAGDGVARGYLNRQALTEERFVKNPFSQAQKDVMYRTGDLGKFLENGEIQCLGRVDHQVKIRGHRIELGEIESALTTISDVKEAVVIAREDHPGDQRLVAYVIPNFVSSASNLSDWKENWDVMYDMGVRHEHNLAISDRNVDAAIHEQLSGRDIRQQVDDWLQQSVKRIKDLKPNRIMEIGCGAGQLLFALAPDVERYIGTDYAQAAIDELSKKIALHPDKWQHVSVRNALADNFSMVEKSSLDVVLIHSVVQYFPDVSYLLKVIEEASKAVAKGGCIFIGDVQGKSTLKMQHTFDQFQHIDNETTIAEFKKIVDKLVLNEKESLIDPALFYLIPQFIPSISAVNVQLRKGEYENEATKYRYDIWLYVTDLPELVNPSVIIDWNTEYTVDAIEQELAKNKENVVQLKNIFNKRMARDYALLQLVEESSNDTTMLSVKQNLNSLREGIDTVILWEIGEKHGFQTHIRWSNDGTDNCIEAIFIPSELKGAIPAKPASLKINGSSINDFFRTPVKQNVVVSQEQIQEWKQQLRALLPDYMVPNDCVVLTKFPLTPNGKIDRKALPKPLLNTIENKIGYMGPRTDIEKLVADIWMECLKLDKVSVFDNFFELGGHSLIALQVMTRLEKRTGKRLPLSTLFEYPTVEKLSLSLQMDSKSITWDSLVPIKPQGTKIPLYIVHGEGLHVLLFNTLAKHMDVDQPIYGLQAKGMNGIDEPLRSIEAIAAYYIDEITKKNPNGPYALAGYSFGGIIAYEMCKQLKNNGKEVKILAMFDTHADRSDYFESWASRLWTDIQFSTKRYLYTFVLLMKDLKGTISYKKESIRRRANYLYSKIKYKQDYYKVFYGNNYKVYLSNQTAARNYRLIPQETVIELFRADERMYYLDDFEFLGWKPYALKGINIHRVPGDHVSMLTPPNDKEFARILQKVLDS